MERNVVNFYPTSMLILIDGVRNAAAKNVNPVRLARNVLIGLKTNGNAFSPEEALRRGDVLLKVRLCQDLHQDQVLAARNHLL